MVTHGFVRPTLATSSKACNSMVRETMNFGKKKPLVTPLTNVLVRPK